MSNRWLEIDRPVLAAIYQLEQRNIEQGMVGVDTGAIRTIVSIDGPTLNYSLRQLSTDGLIEGTGTWQGPILKPRITPEGLRRLGEWPSVENLAEALPDLIFPAPRGGHLRSANFRTKVWLPAVAHLADGWLELDGLRFHDLRHTAASLAISSGANIKAVQRMLGHKHASMTLDRYGHLYTEDLNDLADRLDQKYRGAA